MDANQIAEVAVENNIADDVVAAIFKKSSDPAELFSFALMDTSTDVLRALRDELASELARRNGAGGYGR